MTISSQDAFTRYGVWADIDTARGAWQDQGEQGNVTGWAHNTDVGLFKSDVSAQVTIKIATASSTETWTNFGVTVFEGMATTSVHNHHGGWNCTTCPAPTTTPYNLSNPMGTAELTYKLHDETVGSTIGITFTAEAGKVYSNYLSGHSGNGNSGPHAGYAVTISTAPPTPAQVPLPALAISLLGTLPGSWGAVIGLRQTGYRRPTRNPDC